MSQRTENQVAEMKKQTIGVEVEMNSITREKAARLAATFFGTGRYENTACRNGYCTWSAWDESGREWKFQKDVSIAGPDSEKCEMVTPILTYTDMETLQELIRRLRKAGAKSDATRGCGVHIHIGAKGHTPQTLRNLANIMASHEDLLASALNLDRGRISRYCRTVDPRFLERLNNRKPTTMAALADIWYGSQNADYGRSQHYNDSRQAERTPRWPAQELHSAVPCPEPDGKDGEDGKPQAPAEREPQIRNAHLAPSPRLYWRRVQDRKRAPHEAPGWGCSLPQRQSSRLKDAAQRPPNPLMAGFRW